MTTTDSDKEETQVIVSDESTPSPAATAFHAASKGPEMTATAIARLMGIATSTELKLLEGKLDLIVTRLNALTGKVEKSHSIIGRAPTGSDLERIDVQIGALKKLFSDFLSTQSNGSQKEKPTS